MQILNLNRDLDDDHLILICELMKMHGIDKLESLR